jgi:hypothetical protein
MGLPSRPKLGRRGQVNTGRSGGAGGVAGTTPKVLPVCEPEVVETLVGLVVPVGGAAWYLLVFFVFVFYERISLHE